MYTETNYLTNSGAQAAHNETLEINTQSAHHNTQINLIKIAGAARQKLLLEKILPIASYSASACTARQRVPRGHAYLAWTEVVWFVRLSCCCVPSFARSSPASPPPRVPSPPVTTQSAIIKRYDITA